MEKLPHSLRGAASHAAITFVAHECFYKGGARD
jgi:hypothetical protein